jgi:predicted Zn-dependent peptidase
MEEIKQFSLKNGLLVLNEHIPYIRSILLGLWVKKGSRSEKIEQFGMAHFVEHMLFKGTAKRNAREIAESLECMGGDLNAFTSREHCCYYARSITEHADLIFDVISDIIFNSRFEPEEIEREKNVIFQEIDMYEDSPEDLSHELLVRCMYGKHLGHPVIGFKENIIDFSRDNIIKFHNRFYQPKNLFLTIVGNFDQINLPELSEKYFGSNPYPKAILPPQPKREAMRVSMLVQPKDIGQCHLTIGWHALPISHEDRYILHLLTTYLGGGMASVLFQEIREKQGLVYSIYSFIRAYTDTGFLGIYCAHSQKSTAQILESIKKILAEIIKNGVEEEKLTQLKYQLKTGLLLGLEKTSFRMNRLGVGHLYFERVISVNELIEMIQRVSNEELKRVAKQVFSAPPSIVSVGDTTSDYLAKAIEKTEFQHV